MLGFAWPFLEERFRNVLCELPKVNTLVLACAFLALPVAVSALGLFGGRPPRGDGGRGAVELVEGWKEGQIGSDGGPLCLDESEGIMKWNVAVTDEVGHQKSRRATHSALAMDEDFAVLG